MVCTQVGFAVCSYGVGPRIPVRSSSQAGLLTGSEHSGIGGLPHVARIRRENVGYCIYMAQRILECITVSWHHPLFRRNTHVPYVCACYETTPIFFFFYFTLLTHFLSCDRHVITWWLIVLVTAIVLSRLLFCDPLSRVTPLSLWWLLFLWLYCSLLL